LKIDNNCQLKLIIDNYRINKLEVKITMILFKYYWD